jgi:hypothetical protein
MSQYWERRLISAFSSEKLEGEIKKFKEGGEKLEPYPPRQRKRCWIL